MQYLPRLNPHSQHTVLKKHKKAHKCIFLQKVTYFFSIPVTFSIFFFFYIYIFNVLTPSQFIIYNYPKIFSFVLNILLIYTSNTFLLHSGDLSKYKSFDLSTLSVSLFAFSQFAILSRQVLMLFFNWLMFLFPQNSVVSSAKR